MLMKIERETSRQLIHISCVLFAFLLPFVSASWAFLLAITAFVHNVFLLPRYAPQVFRDQEGLTQGIVLYPLMVGLLILFFPEQLNLVSAGWAILACGDGFSNLVGKRLPIVPMPWHPQKSLGGTLAFIIFSSIAAFGLLYWHGPVPSISHLILVAVVASSIAAIYETLPLPFDDNIVVTLIAASFLAILWPLDLITASLSIPAWWWAVALGVNIIAAGAAWFFRLVSTSGAVSGNFVGTIIFVMGGWQLYVMLILFFVLASGATKFGYQDKEADGIAQGEGGRRGAKHALANCALILVTAMLIGATDGFDTILVIVYCAALATALSDTISSELGQLYGKNPFMPTTFRRVSPGTVGAVSVEGTLFGMGASLIMAIVPYGLGIIELDHIPAITLGGWAGFYIESYIGGYWTEEGIEVNNEWMNLLNTFVGGTVAVIVAFVVHSL